jgi:sterol-4alpha-carboxylate 3-dehydrogenase (decarboxylating)
MSDRSQWGPILIIGGSGRLGHFIAKALHQQPECGRVYSVSRSSEIQHPLKDVDYRVADIRDKIALAIVVRDIRPETIINAAAPSHTDTLTPRSLFNAIFVQGQDTLIALAQEVSTKYMICTTSANVIQGYEHLRDPEDVPYWPDTSTAFAYWVERAAAEKRLLAADGALLQTLSLRLPLIIGEREYAFVPGLLRLMQQGKTNVQIGSDTALMDVVSGEDAARAHVLALQSLMKEHNDVHGEAYNIIGSYPLSFWTMARIVWSEAGWVQEQAPFVLPEWLARWIGTISDAVTRPLGIESSLSMHVLRFMCNSWTYDGSKAWKHLGYEPQDDTEEQLRRSVRWCLLQNASG